MVATTFEAIFLKAQQQGITQKVREAVDWYRKEAGKSTRDATKLIKEDINRLQPTINKYSIGRMFMFYYDAKNKDNPKAGIIKLRLNKKKLNSSLLILPINFNSCLPMNSSAIDPIISNKQIILVIINIIAPGLRS